MIHKSECSNVAQLFFVKLDFDQISIIVDFL